MSLDCPHGSLTHKVVQSVSQHYYKLTFMYSSKSLWAAPSNQGCGTGGMGTNFPHASLIDKVLHVCTLCYSQHYYKTYFYVLQ